MAQRLLHEKTSQGLGKLVTSLGAWVQVIFWAAVLFVLVRWMISKIAPSQTDLVGAWLRLGLDGLRRLLF